MPQKQRVSEMEQEEQEDEYINAFNFLNNFVLTLLIFVIRNVLFCFIKRWRLHEKSSWCFSTISSCLGHQ